MQDDASPSPLPQAPLPRYAPETPLPKRAYLPGRTARPPEPEGHHHDAHSLGDPIGSPAFLRGFRFGIDLFNHGYYWEAHEAWEAQWLPLPPGDDTREQLQGLIQASAALLKLRLDSPAPAKTIWVRGRARLAKVAVTAPDGVVLDVPLLEVIAQLDHAVAAERLPDPPPRITLR